MSTFDRIDAWLRMALYRLGQVRQQLGFVAPLTMEDRHEVALWLPPSALPLFNTMSNADQQHSLRVCRGLQMQGCLEQDMLAAALLHDVGKAQGRVPFWTRPVIVIGKLCAPRLLASAVLPLASVGTDLSRPLRMHENLGETQPHSGNDEGAVSLHFAFRLFYSWRRALSYAWWHAEVGADLAADAGLSEQSVLYIRTHHEPHGPAAALHRVDEVS